MFWSIDWPFSHQLFLFTFIAAIGIFLQRLKIYGFSLGSAAIVFVAMLFGHLGVEIPAIVMNIGIVFFLFSIGIQAGPSFFATLKNDGLSLLFITFILIASAFLIGHFAVYFFSVDKALVLGIINGALTSTPGLATASDSLASPLVLIGYSLAYPFGVIGVILFVRLLPKILHVDLNQLDELHRSGEEKRTSWLKAKSFVVKNSNLLGKKIDDLDPDNFLHATISRLTHQGRTVVPDKDATLQLEDVIKVVASEDILTKVELMVGPEVAASPELDSSYDVKQFILTNSQLVNKTLAELNLLNIYKARVTRIQRNAIELRPSAKTKLKIGDKLTIAYDLNNDASLSALFGNRPNSLTDDLLALFFGISAGILLGLIRLHLPQQITVDLGLSGGVLFAAIFLSHIGKIGPVVWHLSSSTNKVLRELGLVLFFVGVGTKAGQGLSSIEWASGVEALMIGGMMTLLPMVISSFIMLTFFRTNLLKVLGIITGGMTSTPALASIAGLTNSNLPSLYYASVYPFALVLLIVGVKLSALFW